MVQKGNKGVNSAGLEGNNRSGSEGKKEDPAKPIEVNSGGSEGNK